MIADTPLVRNLDNPRYLEVLLNGHATLEERFAQIDIDAVRRELTAARTSPCSFAKSLATATADVATCSS